MGGRVNTKEAFALAIFKTVKSKLGIGDESSDYDVLEKITELQRENASLNAVVNRYAAANRRLEAENDAMWEDGDD